MNDWPAGTMSTTAITGPHRLEPVTLPIPEAVPGTVLVEPDLVGLCGTDLELFHGTAIYLCDGRARYPHVFGHEWVGRVRATAPDVTGWRPGDRVVGQTMLPCGACPTCTANRRRSCPRMSEVALYGAGGAAAPFVRMPATALARVPDRVSDQGAVLTEPAVTVLQALLDSGCTVADRVAVLGTGTIGLLAVQLAARFAGTVDAFGVDPAGIELAGKCGADRAAHVDDAPERTFSLVVEASGAPAAFRRSLELAEKGGRIAAIGVASERVEIRPGDLVLRGLSILGIMHGLDHYQHALDLFGRVVLDDASLIGAVHPAEAVPAAFATLAGGRSGPPKVLLDFAEVDR
jgi:2-desacetyl-2-hydroxyethyl bacteriochlorophyllide A dehydrogenase